MRKLLMLSFFFLCIPLAIWAQYPYRGSDLKWGVIDVDLKVLTPATYDTILFYQNEYTVATKDGHYTHLDVSGKSISATAYDSLGHFGYNYPGSGYANLAVAKIGKQYGLVATNGQPAKPFPIKYESVHLERMKDFEKYKDPLVFIYQRKGKYGCKINGKKIAGPKYDTIYVNFGNPQLLFLEKKGKQFYLNEKGKIKSTKDQEFAFWAVGDPLYFTMSMLEVVEKDGLKGLKNKETGEVVIPERYRDIRFYDNGCYLMVTADGKYGVVDGTGYRILDDQYKSIVMTDEDLFLVEEFSGRKGYMVNQKLLLPQEP